MLREFYTEREAVMARLSTELHDYMRFRAAMERQDYDLDPEFYRDWLNRGVFTFFGVTVDGTGIVSDDQQPAFLEQWRTKQ